MRNAFETVIGWLVTALAICISLPFLIFTLLVLLIGRVCFRADMKVSYLHRPPSAYPQD